MEKSQAMELMPTDLLKAPEVHSRHCTKVAVEIVCSHETFSDEATNNCFCVSINYLTARKHNVPKKQKIAPM